MAAEPKDKTVETKDNDNDKYEMEYRMLGGTGLQVSALSFGFWATYGVKEGVDRCVNVMRICRNKGINLFDNAEAYGKEHGDAEKIMGEALKILHKEDPLLWRRSDIVVTTKLFWGGKNGKNEKGLSRKHLMEGINTSLGNLQLDYVDILFCHRPDPLTPTEEIVRGMSDIVTSGKAFYWGTSEWTAQQYTEAYYIAKLNNLVPPSCEQPQYNMFHRDRLEKEYIRLYDSPYKMGTTIWSPLKSGVLTGKYNKDIPKGSRMAEKGYEFLKDQWEKDKTEQLPIVEKLMTYADTKLKTKKGAELKTTVTCLAIAWCLKNKNVSTVLLGATKEAQIEENLKALTIAKSLTQQNMKEIEDILNNKPTQDSDCGRSLTNITNPF